MKETEKRVDSWKLEFRSLSGHLVKGVFFLVFWPACGNV
jgi:hypothetical protein